MQTRSMRVDVESISVVGVRLAAHMDITSGDGHVRISSIRLSIESFSLCHGFHPFFALNGCVLYLVFLCQIRVFTVAGVYPFFLSTRIQCLPRICGQYRPNHTPGTKSGAFGVGAGTAHGCTWRAGGTSAHPRSAGDPSFGVRSRIHPHVRAHGPVRNTFTRGPAPASAASARSRLSRNLRPCG